MATQLEAAQREARRSFAIVGRRDTYGRWQGRKPQSAGRRCRRTQRRAVLETLGIEVVILPRQKHGPGFEPDVGRNSLAHNGVGRA